MTIARNIALKEKARRSLEGHCLCLKIEGDIVYLPEGYPVDGLKIEETAAGYERAESKLEEIWQKSMFWK